ncbi:MAG: PEP-CTERM sorting domain-containing protein [Verrucomicrobiota bacterium]
MQKNTQKKLPKSSSRQVSLFLKTFTLSFSLLVLGFMPNAVQAVITLSPDEDVMTSGFFQGNDRVRGFQGDNRAVHRVSTDTPFGVSGAETIYISFDNIFDPATFSSPIQNATLTLESVPGGFFADASAGNPFLVSAHGVDLDPLASIIDNTNPGGIVDWLTYFNTNILDADPTALTSVDSFGTIEFDVTSLVNDWISGSNTQYFIALTGKNDTSGNDFLHGFSNNTEAPGSTELAITIPEPSTVILLTVGGLCLAGMSYRRSKNSK